MTRLDDREQFEVLFEQLQSLLVDAEDEVVLTAIKDLHYADLAEIILELDEEERDRLFRLLTTEQAADVFSEVDSETFEELFVLLKKNQKVAVLDQMGNDDIVDLLAEVSENTKQSMIKLLDAEDKVDVEELLDYDEETAGGLMTKDYIAIKRGMTMAQATVYLRENAPDAETVYYVYVIDDNEKLVGIISLRELLISSPWSTVEQVMNNNVIHVHVDTDQEEVARMVSKYDFLVIPVVDNDEKLVGIVTVDDILDVIEEEATEDILKFAGTNDEELEHYEDDILSSIYFSVKARLPWLIITIFGGLLSATVVAGFQNALTADAALALFMPLLAGMGGNVGTQSSTLTVRNLAINDIKGSEVLRTLLQEISVGAIVGIFCGLIIALISYFMAGRYILSLIVGISMFANIVTAATIGTLVPLVFKRVGVDPAVASAPFITTTIDITGLTIYFSLATALMLHIM